MTKQVKTRRVTITKVMGTKSFIDGMSDAKSGRPFKDTWDGSVRDSVTDRQWSYERGRMFWIYLKSNGILDLAIKDGRKITYEAQRLFADAFRAGYVT
jgi:hypothetical protein